MSETATCQRCGDVAHDSRRHLWRTQFEIISTDWGLTGTYRYVLPSLDDRTPRTASLAKVPHAIRSQFYAGHRCFVWANLGRDDGVPLRIEWYQPRGV